MTITSETTKGQKIALDNEGVPSEYPVYSMAILWNMKALTPEQFAHHHVGDTPLDGDALARVGCRTAASQAKWDELREECLERLRNNHHEIDRPNR